MVGYHAIYWKIVESASSVKHGIYQAKFYHDEHIFVHFSEVQFYCQEGTEVLNVEY